MADGHGVTVLLHFQLLKLDKLGASRLQVQPSSGLVDPTVFGGAHQQRHEGGRGDGLVRLCTALVASVGGNLHHGLHLSRSCDYSYGKDDTDDRY